MLTVPGGGVEKITESAHVREMRTLAQTHTTRMPTCRTLRSRRENSFFVDSIARVPGRPHASPFKAPDKIGVAAEQPCPNSRSGR